MTNKAFELTFRGGALGAFPTYVRSHVSMAAAEAEANRVWEELAMEPSEVGVDPSHVGLSSRMAAHDAIVFGPGCGQEGKRIVYGSGEYCEG